MCIEVDAAIEYVHFLEGGLGSTVVPDEYHGTAEVGMQGREGLIGVSVLLDFDPSSHKVFMQTGGPSRRIRVAHLTDAMEQSGSLRKLLLRYAQVFLSPQTGQTAYANARFDMKERLARWIFDVRGSHGPTIGSDARFSCVHARRTASGGDPSPAYSGRRTAHQVDLQKPHGSRPRWIGGHGGRLLRSA